jgi:hypothetical protein
MTLAGHRRDKQKGSGCFVFQNIGIDPQTEDESNVRRSVTLIHD